MVSESLMQPARTPGIPPEGPISSRALRGRHDAQQCPELPSESPLPDPARPNIRRRVPGVMALLCWLLPVALFGGCTVTGTWERVSTEPPNVPFPVDELTLSADRTYTARWEHDGREYYSSGTYEHRHGKLRIAESGRMPREYGARIRFDGRLELSMPVNKDAVKAVLRRKLLPIRQPAAESTDDQTAPSRPQERRPMDDRQPPPVGNENAPERQGPSTRP